MWLKVDEFKNLRKSWWMEYWFSGLCRWPFMMQRKGNLLFFLRRLKQEEQLGKSIVRVWRPSVDGMPFKALERQEVDGFEVSFSKEEVFCAFLELNRDKAPSFDRVVPRTKDFKPISMVGGFYRLLVKRNNSSGVVCKLDVKKVFDHVN
ncbi:hypothetical protein CK203_005830 [Vitis vinifera]|uniref:Uncharacterized protein n=1 Tax=Vitis vinifera TaxID=29760 RepID=A0A438K4F8_VITVI|nr:hypothetical protein CK203_107102 [Vitis vinifera]RVX16090.1 hypothetical protein CK203_005830 [Vitis vinifera]